MKSITLIAPVLLAASLTIVSLATAQPTPPPVAAQSPLQGDADAETDADNRRAGPILQLTEAQEDMLFVRRHAAEPARRERDKVIRDAQKELRALADSPRFDEARAGVLAQKLGQAFAAEELDRAREHAQFRAFLTPEQRAQIQGQKPQHGPGPHGDMR